MDAAEKRASGCYHGSAGQVWEVGERCICSQRCDEGGRLCGEGEALCDEARIRAAFAETRSKLEKEHVVREARTRFRH